MTDSKSARTRVELLTIELRRHDPPYQQLAAEPDKWRAAAQALTKGRDDILVGRSLQLLVLIDGTDAAKDAIRVAKRQSPTMRIAAAQALAQIAPDTPAALKRLSTMAVDDPDRLVRAAALKGVEQATRAAPRSAKPGKAVPKRLLKEATFVENADGSFSPVMSGLEAARYDRAAQIARQVADEDKA